MTLAPGTKLGPYEILGQIGAGGMGEVYKARDTRLERTVAVKVLPTRFAEDADMKQRFEREARAISALSHPHICALHDVGSHEGTEYLVMEYLEGQTLAERLLKGPLTLDQLLKSAVEIASALDVAHRARIVHRDLKPANIMLTKSGVKLLDFGLAKAVAEPITPDSLTALPTERPKNLTQRGTILGTFQYMSPEQLEGKEADERSDVFAFGCVLYEAATGKKAFAGSSQASLISAILKEEPPAVSAAVPVAPPALDRVVKTCLAKDPDERWQNAADLKNELRWIAEGSQAGAPAPAVARRKNRERLAWASAAVALAVAAAAVGALILRPAARPRPVRLSLDAPEKAPFESFDHAAFSPDGRLIAFIAHASGGKRTLWIRPLDSLAATPLAGTDDVADLFWSSNSSSIGFFAEGKLKRVEASGGPPQVLAEAPSPAGGSWNADGVILFSPSQLGGLFRVPATGGAPTRVTKPDPREEGHIWPCFLPDGRHFVFLGDASTTEQHSIRLGSLDSPDTEKLVTGVSNLAFAPPDRLLFVRGGTLVAQRVDVKSRKLVGEPVPIGEQLAEVGRPHRFEFSVSQSGGLLYRSFNPETQLVWLDRSGKRLSTAGFPLRYGRFELSPDEKQVAYEKIDADARHGNLWLLDLVRGSTSRLTSTKGSDYSPVWSPDGRKILFASARSGLADLYEIPAGGGTERVVLGGEGDKNSLGWSHDGKFLLFAATFPATGGDLFVLPLSGEARPRPLAQSRFNEDDGQISPDGRWFAYASDESGRNEVYVQAFVEKPARVQVSAGGGERPRWRADGRELFFVGRNRLQSSEISGGAKIVAGKPRELFPLRFWSDFTVARDGQRILAAIPAEENPFRPMIVVLNWDAAR